MPSRFSCEEKYGLKKKTWRSRSSLRASAKSPSSWRISSSFSSSLATAKSASPYTRAISSIRKSPTGCSFASAPAGSRRSFLRAGEGREVDLRKRLLDELLVIVVGKRLPRDLLGTEHGEVRDLAPDRVQRAARLRLDVLARGGNQLLALGLAL